MFLFQFAADIASRRVTRCTWAKNPRYVPVHSLYIWTGHRSAVQQSIILMERDTYMYVHLAYDATWPFGFQLGKRFGTYLGVEVAYNSRYLWVGCFLLVGGGGGSWP